MWVQFSWPLSVGQVSILAVLWHKPEVRAPIYPLALKLIYASGTAIKKEGKKRPLIVSWGKKKSKIRIQIPVAHSRNSQSKLFKLPELQFPHYNMGRITLMLTREYCEDLIIQRILTGQNRCFIINAVSFLLTHLFLILQLQSKKSWFWNSLTNAWFYHTIDSGSKKISYNLG